MVTDQTSAPVAGATVAVDNGAGFTQSATTDGQGLYVVEVPAGSYNVSVVASGLKIFQANAVLSPGQALTLGVAGALIAQAASSLPAAGQVTAGSAPVPALAAPAQAPAPVPACLLYTSRCV